MLLVRLSHLGDVVLALPVFHAIARAFPEAEIAWAVQPEFAPLLEGMPRLSRTFTFERRGGWRAWPKLRAELAAWRPDLAVDAQGNVKSAMVMLSSGAPRRVGLARADWTEHFAASVLTEEAAPAAGPHGMECALALARVFGNGSDVGKDPRLSAEERARGEAALQARFPTRRPGWILHLAREEDVRSWPARSFEELALRLAREGREVLFLSGPREEALGASVAERLMSASLGPRLVHHWVGQRGLRDLAAVFAAAAARGHRLVACDSGPAHLAASVGLGVTLLAGPQDPRRTGPWPIASRSERPEHEALFASTRPSCQPCFARRCSHPRGPVCMRDLAPDRVADALLSGSAPCA